MSSLIRTIVGVGAMCTVGDHFRIHGLSCRFLPTLENIRNWKRERYINNLLEEILDARLKAVESHTLRTGTTEHPYGNDLLGMMIDAWKGGSPTMTRKQLLDECKTIFVAGHSTTALGITWALFLLGIHPERQQRLRKEILDVGVNVENFSQLKEVTRHTRPHAAIQFLTLIRPKSHLETALSLTSVSGFWTSQMEMFIKEVYRLYAPVANIFRECRQPHKIGDLTVVPGTVIIIPILLMHQSQEYWGDDYDQFRPERWANRYDYKMAAYATFGAGQRRCLGKEFALMETFSMLSTILRQFEISLSPAYRHAPGQVQSIRPLHGMQLLIRELERHDH